MKNSSGLDRLQKRLEKKAEKIIHHIAHHEAAHAVFAHFFGPGLRIVELSVKLDPEKNFDSLGRTTFKPWPKRVRWFESKFRNEAETMLMTAMAGPIAEARYRGGRVAWHHVMKQGTDWHIIDQVSLIHSGGPGLDCRGPYLEYMKVRTSQWVNELWPKIETVATALVERRKLTGEMVADLLRNRPHEAPS